MTKQLPETYAQLWHDFRRNCLDGLVDQDTIEKMEDVFYAGTVSYFNLMRRAFEQGKRGDAFRQFHMMIEDEVRAHFEQLELATAH